MKWAVRVAGVLVLGWFLHAWIEHSRTAVWSGHAIFGAVTVYLLLFLLATFSTGRLCRSFVTLTLVGFPQFILAALQLLVLRNNWLEFSVVALAVLVFSSFAAREYWRRSQAGS
ncbi:hypothetical protein TSACC_22974 [Terrimicrobium sacchariphilum]|uniref:Uncharacterized protein n=1 Tax=Terrimicrobium sacchariphilum TaxID=690879 RepID=A0A146GA82_TERSA|nr:hypothetical protein [Terrimicrobium sacchariphilum]GAT34549.1 hypothetical protein TSACC_22974 [Terrimicrobium sacchariphilum]